MISSGGALLAPGVSKVRPRLLGFRLAGVIGLTKEGDARDVEGSILPVGNGRLAVDEDPRPELREVFTARPFRLRPFLGGGCFWSSKNWLRSSEDRGRCVPIAKLDGGGDSGDDPGDGSVALESSTVEMVVVGEESVESGVDRSLIV